LVFELDEHRRFPLDLEPEDVDVETLGRRDIRDVLQGEGETKGHGHVRSLLVHGRGLRSSPWG